MKPQKALDKSDGIDEISVSQRLIAIALNEVSEQVSHASDPAYLDQA